MKKDIFDPKKIKAVALSKLRKAQSLPEGSPERSAALQQVKYMLDMAYMLELRQTSLFEK